jgi:hypothetical protein
MSSIRGWDADYFLRRAQRIGPATHHAVGVILAGKSFPEQTYKSCLGVLKLAEKYSDERLENVCGLLEQIPRITYQLIKTMLENNRDQLQHHPTGEPLTPSHANVRGPLTYQ